MAFAFHGELSIGVSTLTDSAPFTTLRHGFDSNTQSRRGCASAEVTL